MFYNPQLVNVKGTPIIVYPDEGLEEVLDRNNPESIKEHLEKVYGENKFPEDSNYHIVALWKDGNDVMTDVWIYTKLGEWGSGPLSDVNIFRGTKRETNIGVGSGNTHIVLGREEEHRRTNDSFNKYIQGPRPGLPDYLTLRKDFHIKK